MMHSMANLDEDDEMKDKMLGVRKESVSSEEYNPFIHGFEGAHKNA